MANAMPSPRCPICKKDVAPRKENPAFPFCSPRCRAVDLGRWLGEEYRMPTRQMEEEEDERPTQGPPPPPRDWGDA